MILPRALVTRLLHLAQVAPSAGVRGWVLADDAGQPARYAGSPEPGGVTWAAFLGSAPGQPPAARADIESALRTAPRVLVADLDVRGVLRLDLHEQVGGRSVLREVGIIGESGPDPRQ